jgi:hypothetical protein
VVGGYSEEKVVDESYSQYCKAKIYSHNASDGGVSLRNIHNPTLFQKRTYSWEVTQSEHAQQARLSASAITDDDELSKR